MKVRNIIGLYVGQDLPHKSCMTARDFGRKTMQHYYCSLYRGTEPLLKPPKQPEVSITAKILKKPSEKTRYFFI